MTPLTEAPYDLAPELMNIVVVIHGTQLVTVVEKNYERYNDAVDRMRYAQLGVVFGVCDIAANDFGYQNAEDFQDFIEVVPSAITKLGYY